MNKIPCPICNGDGAIPSPNRIQKKDLNGRLTFIAQTLKDKGYTIREIASMMGYKHPGSISHLLDKPKKADEPIKLTEIVNGFKYQAWIGYEWIDVEYPNTGFSKLEIARGWKKGIVRRIVNSNQQKVK